MRIAVAQLDSGNHPAENLERLGLAARNARAAGAGALLFPELYDVGYDFAQVPEAGDWSERVGDLARRHDLFLAGGMVEREGDRVFNTLQVFDPSGERLIVYRKRHLVSFMGEPEVFTPGDELVDLEFGGLRWGFLICYDLRFPEQARELALEREVDVLCIASAWPFPRREHWRTLLRARAVENQCYVAACNRVGRAGRYTFCGSSAVIDPSGEMLAEAGAEAEEMLVAELTREVGVEVRERLPVRADIRPS